MLQSFDLLKNQVSFCIEVVAFETIRKRSSGDERGAAWSVGDGNRRLEGDGGRNRNRHRDAFGYRVLEDRRYGRTMELSRGDRCGVERPRLALRTGFMPSSMQNMLFAAALLAALVGLSMAFGAVLGACDRFWAASTIALVIEIKSMVSEDDLPDDRL